jgi:hypothetical protein
MKNSSCFLQDTFILDRYSSFDKARNDMTSLKSRQLDSGAGGRTEGRLLSRWNTPAGRSWQWRLPAVLALGVGALGVAGPGNDHIIQHITNGMFGAIIVEPQQPFRET